MASVTVYGVFVFVQSRSLRWMFQSPNEVEQGLVELSEAHDGGELTAGWFVRRFALLGLCLVVVVGLAKTLAPSFEDAVDWVGAPQSFVGVVIALLVLLPESVAAFRAAARGSMQTSVNLALGSALASIGLTIPAIAVASIWLEGPIVLGLDAKEIVLLALTAVVSALTFGSGRATVLQGMHHLAIFTAFVFLSAVP